MEFSAGTLFLQLLHFNAVYYCLTFEVLAGSLQDVREMGTRGAPFCNWIRPGELSSGNSITTMMEFWTPSPGNGDYFVTLLKYVISRYRLILWALGCYNIDHQCTISVIKSESSAVFQLYGHIRR